MAKDDEVAHSLQSLLGVGRSFSRAHGNPVADPMIEADKTYPGGAFVRACEKLKCDPAILQRNVNLHFHMGTDAAGARVAREKLLNFRRAASGNTGRHGP
jgi:hypothetical protein